MRSWISLKDISNCYPRYIGESGTPEELMSKYKIDADYLVKSVLETVEE